MLIGDHFTLEFKIEAILYIVALYILNYFKFNL